MIAQGILDRVAPGVGNHENPLATLGLSRALLRLGLTDDELHEIVRKFARLLLLEVHSDRQQETPRTAVLQRHFAAAFETMKDRRSFDGALLALRRKEVADEAEMRRLREEVQALRSALKRREEVTAEYERQAAERKEGVLAAKRLLLKARDRAEYVAKSKEAIVEREASKARQRQIDLYRKRNAEAERARIFHMERMRRASEAASASRKRADELKAKWWLRRKEQAREREIYVRQRDEAIKRQKELEEQLKQVRRQLEECKHEADAGA